MDSVGKMECLKKQSRKIDIVCVYNNEELFNQLVNSAHTCDDVDVGIIGFDTRGGAYSSAASAFNHAIDNCCTAEVIVFCHQDIIWKGKAISEIYNICIADNNTLFGAAGVLNKMPKDEKIEVISAITDLNYKYNTLSENEIRDVFTLDECMIAANKAIFSKVKFDPITCDSWFGYSTDLCLQCHIEKIRVAAVGLDICHLSGGNITDDVLRGRQAILKKYKHRFLKITTTSTSFYTINALNTIHRIKKNFINSSVSFVKRGFHYIKRVII